MNDSTERGALRERIQKCIAHIHKEPMGEAYCTYDLEYVREALVDALALLAPAAEPEQDAHRTVVQSVKVHTHCTHEQAMMVLGDIAGMLSQVHMAAYNKGFNDAAGAPAAPAEREPQEANWRCQRTGQTWAGYIGICDCCGAPASMQPGAPAPRESEEPISHDAELAARMKDPEFAAEYERLGESEGLVERLEKAANTLTYFSDEPFWSHLLDEAAERIRQLEREQQESRRWKVLRERDALRAALEKIRSVVGTSTESWHIADRALAASPQWHQGDPCVKCGKSHDDVNIGDCSNEPQ